MSLKSTLKQQYEYAKLRGWIPYFASAAARHGFTTADLMGIASRETNMKNIKGDFHDGMYHGFSVMQLDIGSHREWIESGKWQDVATAIEKGAAALKEKFDQIVKTSKLPTAKVRFSSGKTATFTPRKLTIEALRHCTLAAYNCGIASYYHYSIGNDIDRGTTGKDYGRDVIARAAIFQEFLDADGLSSPSNAPVAPAAVRPAESVAEQESAESQAENSAEASTDPAGTDLLGAAVSSEKAKQVGLSLGQKIWRQVPGASVPILVYLWEHKIVGSLILIVIVAFVVWAIYHNRAALAKLAAKMLK